MIYAGDCIFVDHTTGFVHIEHMINFTATETIQAKCHFEKKMLDMGIFVQAYQSDDGIFDTAAFLEEINKELQNITFSKAGAQHENVIAKWGIQSILTRTWMLLIHAVICWPAISDTSLWQMAVEYVLHHHNHMPQDMMSPLDLLLKTQSTQSHFKDMHIWGCPFAMFLTQCYRVGTNCPNGNLSLTMASLLASLLIILHLYHLCEHPNRKDLFNFIWFSMTGS